MPPKANKIATAMAAVNRAVVKNVAAVNKTVVKNYNAANRAINRAPAWVKWTIAAIAVAIIGYALWKVFFAGKKEGFQNYTEENGFPTGGTEAIAYGQALPLRQMGGDNFFWSIDEIDKAKTECDRLTDCSGFARSGNLVIFMKDGYDVKPNPAWKFHRKGAAATTVVGNPEVPQTKWGDAFRPLDADKDKYMVYWRDTQVSATKIMTTKSNQTGNATQAIDALTKATDGSNILVFRGDGTYWLRKAAEKDDFKGAVITGMWDPNATPPEGQFVTVIKKGTTLNFADFFEVEKKTKESAVVVGGGSDSGSGGTIGGGGTGAVGDAYKADYDGNSDNWIIPDDVKYIGIKKFDIHISGQPVTGYENTSFKKALEAFADSQAKVMKYSKDGNFYVYGTDIFNKNDDFRGKNITTLIKINGKSTSVVLMKTDVDLNFNTSQDILNISKLQSITDVYGGSKTLYAGANIGGGTTDYGFAKSEIAISDIIDASNQCATKSFNAGAQGFTLRKKIDTEGIWECWPKKYTADTLKDSIFEYSSPPLQRTYIFDSAKDGQNNDDIVNHTTIGADVPSMKKWWNSSRPVNIGDNGDKFFIRKGDSSKYLDIDGGTGKFWVWSENASYSFQVSGGTLKVFNGTGTSEYTDKKFSSKNPSTDDKALVMTYESGTVVTNLTFTPIAGQVNKYKIFMNSGNSILYYHDDKPWINAYPGFTNPNDAKTEFILEPVMPS